MSNPILRAGCFAAVSFTPAAAAYGAADIIDVAKKIEFGDPAIAGSLIRILTTVVKIDQTAVISGETSYSLALYSVTPPSAQADNAAWTLASADLPSYLGTISLGTPADLGAACYIKTNAQDFDMQLGPGAAVYGELITAGAFTATAVARQILLYGVVL